MCFTFISHPNTHLPYVMCMSIFHTLPLNFFFIILFLFLSRKRCILLQKQHVMHNNSRKIRSNKLLTSLPDFNILFHHLTFFLWTKVQSKDVVYENNFTTMLLLLMSILKNFIYYFTLHQTTSANSRLKFNGVYM